MQQLRDINKYIRDQEDNECYRRFMIAITIVCVSYILLLPSLQIPCVIQEVSFPESVNIWHYGEVIAFAVASFISLTKLLFQSQSSNYSVRVCILLSSLCVTALAGITSFFSLVGVSTICVNAFG